jgi:hypothetical protein
MTLLNSIGSFPDKLFEGFGPIYYPPHLKEKMKKNDILMPVEAGKMCLLEVFYDPDIHDAAGNLRNLDGNIPEHPQHGMPVNFSPPGDCVSPGQRSLLLNWGTSLSAF